VGYEEDSFERFLNDKPRGSSPSIGPWVDRVKAGVSAGKFFQRVHVVKEPLSDYMRFECAWSYRDSTAAGEDVRILRIGDDDWPDGLTKLDYWLWDSAIVAKLYYSNEGRFMHGELTDDKNDVARANEWRDIAVSQSIPFAQYDQDFDDRMRRIAR
jgi:hypothetical protein